MITGISVKNLNDMEKAAKIIYDMGAKNVLIKGGHMEIDAVKKLIQNMGLMEELQQEFDGYIFRFISYHIKQVVSTAKFKQVCEKLLTPYQNKMLNERYAANSKILPLLEALIAKKLKHL